MTDNIECNKSFMKRKFPPEKEREGQLLRFCRILSNFFPISISALSSLPFVLQAARHRCTRSCMIFLWTASWNRWISSVNQDRFRNVRDNLQFFCFIELIRKIDRERRPNKPPSELWSALGLRFDFRLKFKQTGSTRAGRVSKTISEWIIALHSTKTELFNPNAGAVSLQHEIDTIDQLERLRV